MIAGFRFIARASVGLIFGLCQAIASFAQTGESGGTGTAQMAPRSGSVASDYAIETIHDVRRARAALDATAAARLEYDQQWQTKRYECHQRISVNRCLDRIGSERRHFEARLKAIDIHSRQLIRTENLLERNKQEAAGKFGGPKVPGADSGPGSGPGSTQAARTERLTQQQDRLERHRKSVTNAKQLAITETKRRQDRQAALEVRRRDHARRLEEGRRRAKLQSEKRAPVAKPNG